MITQSFSSLFYSVLSEWMILVNYLSWCHYFWMCLLLQSAIFFSGVATLASVFISSKLKPGGHKFIDRGFTDDKLALVIPGDDERQDDIVKFLKEAGSYEVIKVTDY